MTSESHAENTPIANDRPTALVLGRTRQRNRSWSPPALLVSGGGLNDAMVTRVESQPPTAPTTDRHFLIVDHRFGTPIHVFLELDPTAEPGFPGFGVRPVTLEWPAGPPGLGVPAGIAIGRDPHQLDSFRTFGSDKAVAGAGFILIEPRYVGPNWPAYVLAFRPGGVKPSKRMVSDHQLGNSRR
jgi:hypothetical protein